MCNSISFIYVQYIEVQYFIFCLVCNNPTSAISKKSIFWILTYWML